MNATPTSRSKNIDRFYYWTAIVSSLIIFTGFAQTFYLKGLFSTPVLSNLLLVHGLVMTLWFALFITQTRLVAAGRTDLHRRLGVVGAMWVVVIMVVGMATAIDAVRRGATPCRKSRRSCSWPFRFSTWQSSRLSWVLRSGTGVEAIFTSG